MRIAVFSTKTYDREYLNRFNITEKHELTYFEASLNSKTTNLTLGFEAVCVFVNDKIDSGTIEKLSENGIKIIALRSAGFNNVDLEAARQKNINQNPMVNIVRKAKKPKYCSNVNIISVNFKY